MAHRFNAPRFIGAHRADTSLGAGGNRESGLGLCLQGVPRLRGERLVDCGCLAPCGTAVAVTCSACLQGEKAGCPAAVSLLNPRLGEQLPARLLTPATSLGVPGATLTLTS